MKKIFYPLALLLFAALCACTEPEKTTPEEEPENPPVVEQPTVDTATLSISASLQGFEQILHLGGAPLLFEVQAKRSGERDSFRLEVSNEAVVRAEATGDMVQLTALQRGGATLTIRSASRDTVAVSFLITVIEVNAALAPAHWAENVNIDTRLALRFGAAPVLNTSGTIAIYKKDDGTQVDVIKLGDAANSANYVSTRTNFVGAANANNGGRVRAVTYTPVRVEGSSIVIAPHNGVLSYDTEYYVTISDGAIVGFSGLAANEWSFRTKAAAPTGSEVTVAANGSADFCTVQGAIDYVAARGKDEAVTINIRNGVYEEMLYMRNKNNVTIRGESRDSVIIRYNNYEGLNGGSGGSAVKPAANATLTSGGRSVFLIESCDMLRFENLTLLNTHAKTGTGDQAETIYFNSTGRLVAVSCNFVSAQDTILVKGYCWFYNSLIAGDVDFIWGYPNICLIENCEIRTRVDVRNGAPVNQNCYVMQARVQVVSDKGFVFLSCNFTKESGVADGRSYFARSGGASNVFDNVSVINCTLGSHIAAEGWYNSPLPTPATATASGGWKEYKSKDAAGNPVSTAGRLANSYQLSDAEYEAGYATRAAIFGGYANGTAWMQE